MAPPSSLNRSVSYSLMGLIVGILIGLTVGRLTLNARWCAILGQFGIHLSGCLPDLKPGVMSGGRGPEFCKAVTVSTDIFVTVTNVGYVDAPPSSTEVTLYPPGVAASTTTLSTPAIPVGGSYTAQIPGSTATVATIDFPVQVVVDSKSAIAELDENNNTLYGRCSR